MPLQYSYNDNDIIYPPKEKSTQYNITNCSFLCLRNYILSLQGTRCLLQNQAGNRHRVSLTSVRKHHDHHVNVSSSVILLFFFLLLFYAICCCCMNTEDPLRVLSAFIANFICRTKSPKQEIKENAFGERKDKNVMRLK